MPPHAAAQPAGGAEVAQTDVAQPLWTMQKDVRKRWPSSTRDRSRHPAGRSTLTLPRLDSLAQLDDVQPVAIDDLLQSAVMEMYHHAQQSAIELRLHLECQSYRFTPASRCCSACWCATCWIMPYAIARAAARLISPSTPASFRVRDNGPGISPQRGAHRRAFLSPAGAGRRAAAWACPSSDASPRCTARG